MTAPRKATCEHFEERLHHQALEQCVEHSFLRLFGEHDYAAAEERACVMSYVDGNLDRTRAMLEKAAGKPVSDADVRVARYVAVKK